MDKFREFIFSYLGAIIFIIIGILKVRNQYKKPVEMDDSPLQPYISGWVWGIGIIAFGIIILIGKIQGKI